MQVIAADLDQAQQVADFLQRTLDDREHQLHSEVQQSDMNNQMIKDELAKLYDILEAQREEIGRLNTMLDTISGQGGIDETVDMAILVDEKVDKAKLVHEMVDIALLVDET
ncbi:hypothetical protein DPMN_179587 [Dreissena polymorpha]|uniref:Uncharacterized protein n=1 Tax=Dreissena polymorpha TaxID=45954 RepID=A0A9D4ECL6_DREPO|nr:hypothetical protein DPMN_179587 [Dreissena polymorpha]